jgi:hypothetical protein
MMRDDEPTDEIVDSDISPAKARKPYQPPQLVRLGGMREVTQKVGWRGRSDGGRFPYGFRTAY